MYTISWFDCFCFGFTAPVLPLGCLDPNCHKCHAPFPFFHSYYSFSHHFFVSHCNESHMQKYINLSLISNWQCAQLSLLYIWVTIWLRNSFWLAKRGGANSQKQLLPFGLCHSAEWAAFLFYQPFPPAFIYFLKVSWTSLKGGCRTTVPCTCVTYSVIFSLTLILFSLCAII